MVLLVRFVHMTRNSKKIHGKFSYSFVNNLVTEFTWWPISTQKNYSLICIMKISKKKFANIILANWDQHSIKWSHDQINTIPGMQ